jgi:hypothetical protein
MDTTVLMSKVAEVAPQHYEFLVKTASEVKDSPFKDEILTELDGLMKMAFQMPGWAASAGKSMMSGAGAIGGAAMAGIAYALAGDMYDAARRGITKSRNYQSMLDANPGLKRLPAKDVQRSFSVLHKLNPEFAAEPSIAGAWVQRAATYGEDALADTNSLKSLIDSRKGLSESKRLPQPPTFDLGERMRKKEKHPFEMSKAKHEADKAQNEAWTAHTKGRAAEHTRDAAKTRAETEALRHQYYANLGQTPTP